MGEFRNPDHYYTMTENTTLDGVYGELKTTVFIDPFTNEQTRETAFTPIKGDQNGND